MAEGSQTYRRRVPELLAPAGTFEAALAALAAGADAVYLGVGPFDARAAAPGLTEDELAAVCALAHRGGGLGAVAGAEGGAGAAPPEGGARSADAAQAAGGVALRPARVYVTLNALVRGDELPRVVEEASRARAAGADAFIVADAGLARTLARELPGVELHLSTQAGAQDAAAVRVAAREFGATRVTCARELSLPEIAAVCATGIDIEVFCHGAICVSYSGACAFSALRRGRSAMRGDCTQPCRLSYRLVEPAGATVSPRAAAGAGASARGDAAGADGAACAGLVCATERERAAGKLLCPRDYLGLRHLPVLVAAGVAALKIEGRMKNPDYVYNVVAAYRTALDAIAAGEPCDADALERGLGRSFNRGFTDAYLRGQSGAELMSLERSCNQGVRVGVLVERRHGEVVVALEAPVAVGDVLEIRSTPGPDAPADVPERWPQVPCDMAGASGERILVRCKRKVEVGSAVHLVRSAAVLRETAAALERMREVARQVGQRPAAGFAADGADAVRGADSRACDDAERVAAFGSERPLKRVDVPGQGDAGALSRAARAAHRSGGSRAAAPDGFCAAAPASAPRAGAPHIAVTAASPAQAAACLARDDVDEVAVYAWRVADDPVAWRPLLARLTLVLDEVARAVPDGRGASAAARAVPDGRGASAAARAVPAADIAAARRVVCRSLGQLDVARASGRPFDVAAPLPCWNGAAASWFARLGAQTVWLADELAIDDAVALAAHAGVPALGVLAYGRPQLMVTEHCLLTAEGPCRGACGTCARRRARRMLEEEATGDRLPVVVDGRGRTRIFDARPLDRIADVPALLRAGVASFAVDAACLDEGELAAVLDRLAAACASLAAAARKEPR